VVVDGQSIARQAQQWFAHFSRMSPKIRIQCYKSAMKKKLDAINRQLLALLQVNAETPLAELAEAVNLSSTPCWRRLQMLREAGYITRHVALVDPVKVNLGVTVFVTIKTNQHNAQWLKALSDAVQAIPEVVEFYRMSGDVDYLLRVVVPDIRTYDTVYQRLIRAVPMSDVSSSFAMEELKFTTALPLDYAD
jgi:Lrp/AsnC family transcriptional regulator